MEALMQRMKSKTYWLGLATLALGGLEAAQATGMIPDLFDGALRAAITIGVAVMIFVLREVTSKPLAEK